MRVLIIGAGIAGPVAAMAMHRAGFDVAIYESRPRETAWRGSYLTLATNGLDALSAVTASSGVERAGFVTRDIHLHAVVLAQCLRDHRSVADAFAAFERMRRSRVERIVAHGARSSSSKAPGAVGRVLRDLLMPIVFRYVVTERSLDWMYQHHLEWDRTV